MFMYNYTCYTHWRYEGSNVPALVLTILNYCLHELYIDIQQNHLPMHKPYATYIDGLLNSVSVAYNVVYCIRPYLTVCLPYLSLSPYIYIMWYINRSLCDILKIIEPIAFTQSDSKFQTIHNKISNSSLYVYV